jgi:hypothetical protein
LDEALQHGVVDTMAIQKYDIRRPEAEGGGCVGTGARLKALADEGEARAWLRGVGIAA